MRTGVAPPLPARYEAVDGGHFKLRVQTADALTKDWRTNLQAADIGTVPPVVDVRPRAPKAYNLPKVVLERQPDESLNSARYAPEYACAMSRSTSIESLTHLHEPAHMLLIIR